jgi:hypothetical protein
MLYSEIIAVCSEIHTKHINTVRTAQYIHPVSVIQTSQLMLYSPYRAVNTLRLSNTNSVQCSTERLFGHKVTQNTKHKLH